MRILEEKIFYFFFLLALAAFGIHFVFLLKPSLVSSNQALGEHTISLLLPTSLPFFYLFIISLNKKLKHYYSFFAPVLAIIVCMPLYDLLSEKIIHFPTDDSFRYSIYAHNIISTPTLWGGDNLFHNNGSLEFFDQPGYRYYLALAISICRGENRAVQVLGIVLTSISFSFAHANLIKYNISKKIILQITFFWLLSSAYMFKNILYGYTEWFTVILAWISTSFLLAKKPRMGLIAYALIPFIRQNLIIASLLIAILITAKFRIKIRDFFVFYLIPVLLPLYHNLYFAEKFKFFVSNTGSLFDRGFEPNFYNMLLLISSKVLGYFAIPLPLASKYFTDSNLGNPSSFLEYLALIFVPLGTLLCLSWVINTKGRSRYYLITFFVVTILPTLILGWGSYPRFQFVNLHMCISLFVSLFTIFNGKLNYSRDFIKSSRFFIKS